MYIYPHIYKHFAIYKRINRILSASKCTVFLRVGADYDGLLNVNFERNDASVMPLKRKRRL